MAQFPWDDSSQDLSDDLQSLNFHDLSYFANSPEVSSILDSIIRNKEFVSELGNFEGLNIPAATLPDFDPGADLFMNHFEESTIATTPISGTQTRPRQKSKKSKTKFPIMDEMAVAPSNYESYSSTDELGATCLSSASSYCSDAGSSVEDFQNPRRRRPRVSYSTLTEEEKRKHIRNFNNEACRTYRGKQKQHLALLAAQLPALVEKNKQLKHREAQLADMKRLMHSHLCMSQIDQFNQF